jgi:hypothetical protein
VSVVDKDPCADWPWQHIMCVHPTAEGSDANRRPQESIPFAHVDEIRSWLNDLSVVVGEIESRSSSLSLKGSHDASHQLEAENLPNAGRKMRCIAKSMASRISNNTCVKSSPSTFARYSSRNRRATKIVRRFTLRTIASMQAAIAKAHIFSLDIRTY